MPKILTPENYYQDHEYISNSMLWDFEKGEYYFYLKHIKCIKEPYFSRDYFDFWKAVDIFFEQWKEVFNQLVHIVSKRTGKVPEGEIELTESAGKVLKQTIDEMQNQPLIRMYNTGLKQQILQVEDYRWLKLKGKTDIINIEEWYITDDKTAANIEKFDPNDYSRQLTFYGMLAEIIYWKKFRCFLSVGDKNSDYARSEMYELSDETRERNLFEINEALDKIKDRMEYNTWAVPQDRRSIFGTALYKHMPNYEIKEPVKF